MTIKLLQPDFADAERLARHVETYPDAVRVLFYCPTVEAKSFAAEDAAGFANAIFEEEQRRRVRDYVRARRALADSREGEK